MVPDPGPPPAGFCGHWLCRLMQGDQFSVPTLGLISQTAMCRATSGRMYSSPPARRSCSFDSSTGKFRLRGCNTSPCVTATAMRPARRSLSHRADDAAGSGISRLIKPAACAAAQTSSSARTPRAPQRSKSAACGLTTVTLPAHRSITAFPQASADAGPGEPKSSGIRAGCGSTPTHRGPRRRTPSVRRSAKTFGDWSVTARSPGRQPSRQRGLVATVPRLALRRPWPSSWPLPAPG